MNPGMNMFICWSIKKNVKETFLLMFSAKFIPLPVHVQLNVPTTYQPNNTVNFRKLLLKRCQKEFEKDEVDDVVFQRKQKELDSDASVSVTPDLYRNVF